MGSLVVVVAQERILFLLINMFVFHFPRIGILLLGVIPIINTVVDCHYLALINLRRSFDYTNNNIVN